jgi:alanine or glycine:cation symporter, AGCS family
LFGEGQTREIVFKVIFCIFVIIGAAANLGRVDKLDSQIAANMIQDSFCGGCFGSIVDGRRRMGVF